MFLIHLLHNKFFFKAKNIKPATWLRNMWLGGCGNTPTDLAKHVAKIVPEKTPKLSTKIDSGQIMGDLTGVFTPKGR